ncbi:DUF1841 family protein [Chitinimonas sp. BJB300]|uniref:DUF1841 family protein n=1 Tax=Chitinimonas sp. BJB300 TaxID=1559339 RepID=UPI000C108EF9|nr:DUF1841 family protein [Chitinimonas sp. BJB300]PHV10815.1 hypothetical protein CSQ89_14200 [Chitinimonas sp. BJB300]TSJ87822.1 DUF1841 family protein [Chitinimonas sp. BJB300]
MFNPSRDQARQFLFDTWAKYKQNAQLTDLERIAFAVLKRHPEYQPIVDAPERYLDKDYLPEFGETNPFLHMNMHLAIEEQLTIDQPPGVRDLFRSLCEHTGDEHSAQHEMMDCLAEMIWQAQRSGTSPNGALYIACIRRKAGLGDNGT